MQCHAVGQTHLGVLCLGWNFTPSNKHSTKATARSGCSLNLKKSGSFGQWISGSSGSGHWYLHCIGYDSSSIYICKLYVCKQLQGIWLNSVSIALGTNVTNRVNKYVNFPQIHVNFMFCVKKLWWGIGWKGFTSWIFAGYSLCKRRL